MSGFFLSPYSIPLAGIALGAFAILVSAYVKINKAKYQAKADEQILDELRSEIDRVKTRVEALESIVVNLDNRIGK